MSKRKNLVIVAAGAVVVGVLTVRAVTVHSVGSAPLIYRVTTNNNDLDSVEGLAPPGRLVELWYKQRNFREGTEAGIDPLSWCPWKNNGTPIFLGSAWADARGKWRLANLRHATPGMLFPPAAGHNTLSGRRADPAPAPRMRLGGLGLHRVDAAHAALAQREKK